MFFLRCVFWLSVVYASMSWAPGSLAPAGKGANLVAAARSQGESLLEATKDHVAAYCMHHARECLDDAKRLSSLVTTSASGDQPQADEPDVTATIPLPVPDPRRHAAGAKLAHAP